jgi:hypothetical protein
MKTKQKILIKKFETLSLKYHKMSLLYNELGESIDLELKNKGINPNSEKQIKEYLKGLNLDYDKLKNLSIMDISFNTIIKGGERDAN